LRRARSGSILRPVVARRPIRRGLYVACAAVLLTPYPASGATVTVSDGQMKVTATAPGRNVIDVNPDGLAFRVYDSLDSITAGQGCILRSRREAVCGGLIMVIRIEGGDGQDLLGLWDVQVPVIARGGGGDDLIETGGAADDIDSGAGRDAVEGGEGDDTLMGGAHRDRIEGGPGSDDLAGEDGPDVLRGGDGDDRALGGADGDLVDGGAGPDQLTGGEGDNAIDTRLGNDTVITGTGADTVYAPPRNPGRVRCRFTRRGPRIGCPRTRARVVVERPPTAWPPSSEASASPRARAAIDVPVYARLPAEAKRLSVTVSANRTRRVRVCIRIFTGSEKPLGRFPKRVDTGGDTVKSPRRKTVYASGHRRKKGCPRRIK
jgi:hypothetical protein